MYIPLSSQTTGHLDPDSEGGRFILVGRVEQWTLDRMGYIDLESEEEADTKEEFWIVVWDVGWGCLCTDTRWLE